jgi:hypothetical protein
MDGWTGKTFQYSTTKARGRNGEERQLSTRNSQKVAWRESLREFFRGFGRTPIFEFRNQEAGENRVRHGENDADEDGEENFHEQCTFNLEVLKKGTFKSLPLQRTSGKEKVVFTVVVPTGERLGACGAVREQVLTLQTQFLTSRTWDVRICWMQGAVGAEIQRKQALLLQTSSSKFKLVILHS